LGIRLCSFFFKTEFIGAQTTLHCCYIAREKLINGGYYKNCRLDKFGKTVNDKKSEDEVMRFTKEILRQHDVTKFENKNDNYKKLKMFLNWELKKYKDNLT